jgi:predicted RNase H-like nuclease (RuvC/YqgF family)
MKAVCDYESSKAEFLEIGREEGAAREREKWESENEALRSKFEAERSEREKEQSEKEALRFKFEAERSEVEALKRELERLRAGQDPTKN